MIGQRIRYLGALVALGALTGLLLYDLSLAEDPRTSDISRNDSWWAFHSPVRPGDSFDEVVRRLPVRPNWYTFYLGITAGLAAREAAGGPIDEIVVPERLDRVQVTGPKGERPSVHLGYLEAMTGDHVVGAAYDSVLSPAAIAAFEEEGRVVAFQWDSYAVVGDAPSRRIVLFQDEAGERVYLVPRELLAEGAAP